MGDYEKVIEVYERYPGKWTRVMANAAVAYFNLDQTNKGEEIVEYLKSITSGIGSPDFCLGLIYAQLGEIDLAFTSLEKAYSDR